MLVQLISAQSHWPREQTRLESSQWSSLCGAACSNLHERALCLSNGLECHWRLEMSHPPSQDLVKVATLMPRSMAVLKILLPGTQTGMTVYSAEVSLNAHRYSLCTGSIWILFTFFLCLSIGKGETNRSPQDPCSGYYFSRDCFKGDKRARWEVLWVSRRQWSCLSRVALEKSHLGLHPFILLLRILRLIKIKRTQCNNKRNIQTKI